jgi:hypothetical protein
MKYILLILVCATALGAGPANSVYNQNRKNENIIVKEKVVQFGSNLKIVGIPVTDLGPEYYYRKSPQKGEMINEDSLARKIAEEIAKKLVELGIRPVEPNKQDQTVAKANDLIDKRCASCHSGDNPDAGLSFVDEGGKLKLVDKNEKLTQPEIAWLMFSNVLDETMPKSGNKLNLDETKVVHEYAKYLTKQEKTK